MLNIEVEELTAKEAEDLGLIDAIKRGELEVEGSYKLTSNGDIIFNQRNFIFKDKIGNNHCAKFATDLDIVDFWELFTKNEE